MDQTHEVFSATLQYVSFKERVTVSHQTGIITFFDQSTGIGYLSCHETSDLSVIFDSREVDGLKSLAVGEPVSYELVQERRNAHAEHIKRTIGNLEVYQDLGGLYS